MDIGSRLRQARALLRIAAGAFHGKRRGEGRDGYGLQVEKIEKMAEGIVRDSDAYGIGHAIHGAIAIAGEGGELAGTGIARVVLHQQCSLPLLKLLLIDHGRDMRLHVADHIAAIALIAVSGRIAGDIAREFHDRMPGPEHFRKEDDAERHRDDDPDVEKREFQKSLAGAALGSGEDAFWGAGGAWEGAADREG